MSQPAISSLRDDQLLSLCSRYGSQVKLWKRKFLGLLPEVERRRLYEQEGCGSIFEFAAKVGGVSRDQVFLVLNLEKRFEPLPQLQQALVSGDIPVHKLARVVSVATLDNQDFWYSQAKLLSQTALETLVRDSKGLRTQTANINKKVKITKVEQSEELELSEDVRGELLNLQNKGLDINLLLRIFLEERQENIQRQKQEIVQTKRQSSRYIPAKVKNILKQEYGTKCAHTNCTNASMNLHHQVRFSSDPIHNPLYLIPVCKQHHEIAHTIDQRVDERRWNR